MNGINYATQLLTDVCKKLNLQRKKMLVVRMTYLTSLLAFLFEPENYKINVKYHN